MKFDSRKILYYIKYDTLNIIDFDIKHDHTDYLPNMYIIINSFSDIYSISTQDASVSMYVMPLFDIDYRKVTVYEIPGEFLSYCKFEFKSFREDIKIERFFLEVLGESVDPICRRFLCGSSISRLDPVHPS